MILQVLYSHMQAASPTLLKPRKSPRQARSAATVDAIFEATIQVLLAGGEAQLTTTRIAERAGVSVGTMYQYFPHKKALLYAVLRHRLEAVPHAMESAAANLGGLPLIVISDGIVAAWLDVKTKDVATTRALYAIALDFDTEDLIGEGSKRVLTAIERLLTSAADFAFENPAAVSFILRAVLGGTVRTVLERGATAPSLTLLRAELPLMCRAYLLASAQPIAQSSI
ncbi:MAG: TetR/AcrR family transcriptional regulator [Proteobacteria bacterium]|nr:TetR/AcrR family transcriptional regulator [Pseudomonadota bacterium]